MKIPKPQLHPEKQPKPHMTREQIRDSIKAQEQHFEDLMSRVDESKTLTSTNSLGNEVSVFYDKDGNELYKKTHQNGSETALNMDTYSFKASDGGHVNYYDYDSDGSIDMMAYMDENDFSQYQAFDKDDDGTFDTATSNWSSDYGEFELDTGADVQETNTKTSPKTETPKQQTEEKSIIDTIISFITPDD